jgi:hypothetical protein
MEIISFNPHFDPIHISWRVLAIRWHRMGGELAAIVTARTDHSCSQAVHKQFAAYETELGELDRKEMPIRRLASDVEVVGHFPGEQRCCRLLA